MHAKYSHRWRCIFFQAKRMNERGTTQRAQTDVNANKSWCHLSKISYLLRFLLLTLAVSSARWRAFFKAVPQIAGCFVGFLTLSFKSAKRLCCDNLNTKHTKRECRLSYFSLSQKVCILSKSAVAHELFSPKMCHEQFRWMGFSHLTVVWIFAKHEVCPICILMVTCFCFWCLSPRPQLYGTLTQERRSSSFLSTQVRETQEVATDA